MPVSAIAARRLAQQQREAAVSATVQAVAPDPPAPSKEINAQGTTDTARSSKKRKRKEPNRALKQVLGELDEVEIITTRDGGPKKTPKYEPASGTKAAATASSDHIMSRVESLNEQVIPSAPIEELGFSSDESTYEGTTRAKDLPRYEVVKLSTVKKAAVEYQKPEGRRAAIVRITRGEQAVAVGQYELQVRKGSIAVYGAVLHAGSNVYRIHAPSTHALPVITAAQHPFGGDATAEVVLSSCNSGMRLLKTLNPSFDKLWNDPSLPDDRRSFRILWSSDEDNCGRPLRPLAEPNAWKTLAASLINTESSRPPVIIVCGPKGTGKSTFTRFIINAFLCSQKYDGVAYMDIDPGQPEYRPPGDLSLCVLKEYNFGPSYCHPNCVEGRDKVSRAHHYGYITPRDDLEHYEACVLDLHKTYQKRHPGLPLIVNCSGWIQGSGLEALNDLIKVALPTNVVYTSIEGPEEVLETLHRATKATGARLHTLASIPGGPGLRTSANLRAMLTMSYFHSDAVDCDDPRLHWSSLPIDDMEQQEWSYADDNQIIDAVTPYTDFIQPEFLSHLLEMSVLGVVAVYNHETLKKELARGSGVTGSTDSDAEEEGESEDTWHEFTTESRIGAYDTHAEPGWGPNSAASGSEIRALRRTPEGLPYFFPGTGRHTPFDPASSETLGQVLVRGIDEERQCLRVVTPVSTELLEKHRAQGAAIVLVKGKLDRPEWAHFEPMHVGLWREQEYEKWKVRFKEVGGTDDVDSEKDHMKFDVEAWAKRTPYVSVIKDQDWEWRRKQRPWKVRRNLETSDGK